MLAFIPDIAEEHYEELQFLWTQRRNALRSSAYTMREMGMLEERIEAQTQGLLVLGDHLLELVSPGSPATTRCRRSPRPTRCCG